jgi:hypothetical protein
MLSLLLKYWGRECYLSWSKEKRTQLFKINLHLWGLYSHLGNFKKPVLIPHLQETPGWSLFSNSEILATVTEGATALLG